MTLDARSCRMLEEMGLGPVWLLRETEDPLLLGAAALRPAPGPAPALHQSPAAAKESLARPARQRPAAGPQNPPSARSAQPASAPVTVQAGLPPETAEAIASADWAALRKIAEGCRACAMASTRQHVVFSEGDPGPKLVIIGEAPGAEEDLQGIPFVGKSGQLLTAMLDALGIVRKRDAVILNVLKCRPPRNRNPEPGEIACCGHFLRRQLELLEPAVLFLAGRFAVEAMLHPEPGFSIGRQRGRVHEVEIAGRKVPAVVTYHPSYLLRSPDEKAKAWDDLLLLKRTMAAAGVALPEREKRWN